MTRLFIAIILSILAFTGRAELNTEAYMQYIEEADSAIAHNEYQRAISLLHNAMKLEPANPSNVWLLSNMGMLQYYLGMDSAALATLDVAHSMAPASVTVLLNRAKVNNGTGHFADALNDYTMVTQLDSTLMDPWVQRAMLQLRGGDVRGAEASMAKAEGIDANCREVVVGYALLYSHTNRPDKAIPYLDRLIKKEPLSEYYAERAMCRLRLDNLPGASDDISRGLKLDDSNPELYAARALLHKKRYREEDSRADAQRALELGLNPARLKALGILW